MHELVFFDGQLERILNIDESEVTTDGTSKLTGGRLITKYYSTDTRISVRVPKEQIKVVTLLRLLVVVQWMGIRYPLTFKFEV